MKLPLLLAAVCAAAAVLPPRAAADTSHLAFKDPAKPGTLRLNVASGRIRVHGTKDADITVETNARPNDAPRKDGLRVLTAVSGYSVRQQDNEVSLDFGYGRARHGETQFDIGVPPHTAVIISSYSGDTTCTAVDGDLEIHNSSGRVTLSEVRGGASVETMNGPVTATIAALVPGHPLSFTSMNGQVELHLPKDAKANLQLRTQNGSILTDFDESDLVAKSSGSAEVKSGDDEGPGTSFLSQHDRDAIRDAAREAAQAAREAAQEARQGLAEAGIGTMPPMPPLPPMTGGRTVSGVLHGGGVEISAATMNGDVIVRKE
jgi:uncharacterized membrane protein